MSTYPLRKLIPDTTMASVCFLLPTGSQMIYLGAKKILTLQCLCVRCVCLPCNVISPPGVPLSHLSDPLLSCLLVGVRVMQGVTAVHAEHHTPLCGLFCRLVDDIALCLSVIRRAPAFRFSGDRRDFILVSSYPTHPQLLGRVATVYVVPSHNEGSAGGATGILLLSLRFSEQVTMLWAGG